MSWGEFIELRDLRSGREQVDLTRLPCSPPRLERANALRISPGKVPDLLSRVGIIRVLSSAHDPQITEEKGEGHNFQPRSQAQPTWCDLCGNFIWGLYKQSLRCTSELHTHLGAAAPRQKCFFFCLNTVIMLLLIVSTFTFSQLSIELPETSCHQPKVSEVAVVFRSSSERAAS